MNKIDFEFDGKKYPGIFNLNVMADLQEKFGSVDVLKLIEGDEPNIIAIRFLMTKMINEAERVNKEKEEKKYFTEEEIGSMVTIDDLLNSSKVAQNIIVRDTESKEEKN